MFGGMICLNYFCFIKTYYIKMAIKRKDSEKTRIVIDKLRQDVNNKLFYWLKKIPRYNELNSLLLLDTNLTENETKILNDELETMKSLFNINKSKNLLDKQREIDSEKYELMTKSFEYKSLLIHKNNAKKALSKTTSHWYIKQINDYRNNLKISDSVLNNEVAVLGYLDVDTRLINYRSVCNEVATLMCVDISEIFTMNSNKIKTSLDEVFKKSGVNLELKKKLVSIEIMITKYMSEFLQKPDITKIIFSAFGDLNNQKTEKILKEIMFSAHILTVYAISSNVCLRTKNMHLSNDAVGFGLEGLMKAINKWYETQLIANQPISFDAFMFKYISYDVTNGLRDLGYSGMIKSSNLNTIRNKNRDEIKSFLDKNPQYSHLDENTLFEMLLPHSKTLKRISSVSNESTIKEIITVNDTESDAGGYDIFSETSDEINSDEMLETNIEYDKMLAGLHSIFDTGKFSIYDYNSYDEPLYEETTEKMFSVYDKELFLMDIGFKYKHTTNKPYTLKEMSEILKQMYKNNGVTSNRIGEDISFGNSTISIRLKKIRENIKFVIKHKPSLVNGFKYFVTIMDDENFRITNMNSLIHISNIREQSNTK